MFTSDRLEQTLNQVSKSILSIPDATDSRYETIWGLLSALIKLENRPLCLTEMAYEWCPMIWETFRDRGWLLLRPLEIGFRHLDFSNPWVRANLTHVKHDQNFLNTVFEINEIEAIADLLQALTTKDLYGNPALSSLRSCVGHIVNLHNRVAVPFSPRLRRLVIRSIGHLCCEGFEEVEPGIFVGVLNHLHISLKDMDWPYDWTLILMGIIQSTEGVRHLDTQVWGLLMELMTSYPRVMGDETTYDTRVMEFLLGAQEWEKLECWLGVVWMAWLPEPGDVLEDLKNTTNLLFHQKPDAAQKLTQWIRQYCQKWNNVIPTSFRQICERAQPEPV